MPKTLTTPKKNFGPSPSPLAERSCAFAGMRSSSARVSARELRDRQNARLPLRGQAGGAQTDTSNTHQGTPPTPEPLSVIVVVP